jgi:CRP-like cAMP-binding protein
VVVVEPTRIFSWPRDVFQQVLKETPDLDLALQASLGEEILSLLKAERDRR